MDLKFLENFRLIRLGPGIVSKSTAAFIVLALAAMGLGVVSGDLAFRYVAIGLIFLAFVVTLVYNAFFTLKHPAGALVEGAQLVAYERLQAEAKGLLAPLHTELTPSPIRALPPTYTDEGEEGATNG